MEQRQTFRVTCHLFLKDGDSILLYQRKGGPQDQMYNVIAGHLDGGEDPRDAMIREAKEEAGISITKEDLVFANVTHSMTASGKEFIQFYFFCEKWSGEICNLESERCYEMKFFPLSALPTNTTPYLLRALHLSLDGVVYDEFQES